MLTPSDCPRGIHWPFLSNAAHASLFSPHLLVVDASIWGTILLGRVFRQVICGFYLFSLLVRLPSKIQKLLPDPPVRGLPGVWKLPLLWLPSRDGSLSLALLSLFLSFIFCPTSFWRQWAAFLGTWCPLLDQKLFCGVCSVFKCSFDEFVGEKVVSPSYSSAIFYIQFKWHILCAELWEDIKTRYTKKKVKPCTSWLLNLPKINMWIVAYIHQLTSADYPPFLPTDQSGSRNHATTYLYPILSE